MAVDYPTLRSLFRHLQAFQSLFESDGVSVLIDPDGVEWSLEDLKYLFANRVLLSPRQKQAIELCLVQNLCERDAALAMGIGESSPVSIYANNGLKRMIELIESGVLPRFRPDGWVPPPVEEPEELSVAA